MILTTTKLEMWIQSVFCRGRDYECVRWLNINLRWKLEPTGRGYFRDTRRVLMCVFLAYSNSYSRAWFRRTCKKMGEVGCSNEIQGNMVT